MEEEHEKLKKKVVIRRRKSFPLIGSIIFIVGLIWMVISITRSTAFPLWPLLLTLLGFAIIFERII